MPRMVIRTIVETLTLSAPEDEAKAGRLQAMSLGYTVNPETLAAAHRRADAAEAAMMAGRAYWFGKSSPEVKRVVAAMFSPPLRARGWKWRR
jgi:hypothetical protein